MLIGICGASGSGKTTLANKIAKAVKGSIVLNQDAYYLDRSNLSAEERAMLNYDHPDSFDHQRLLEDVRALLDGKAVARKSYDYVRHMPLEHPDEMMKMDEDDLIIVEGIHAFHDEELRSLMDLCIFIDIDPDICLLRRIRRDLRERGRDIDGIYDQYTKMVKPMFEQYIRPARKHADVIVNGGGKNDMVTEIIAGHVENARHKA